VILVRVFTRDTDLHVQDLHRITERATSSGKELKEEKERESFVLGEFCSDYIQIRVELKLASMYLDMQAYVDVLAIVL